MRLDKPAWVNGGDTKVWTMKEDKHLSGTAKEQRLPGERSRRDFLKLGDIGVAGLASPAVPGANPNGSTEEIPVVLEQGFVAGIGPHFADIAQ